MREVLHRKVATGAIPDARVWDLDLSTQPPPDERFDLVVTVMVLHHVADVGAVLAAFHRLLESGGHLCVADLEEEDGSFHGEGFEGHRGFAPAALASELEGAGFANVRVEPCGSIERDGATYHGCSPPASAGPAMVPHPNGDRLRSCRDVVRDDRVRSAHAARQDRPVAAVGTSRLVLAALDVDADLVGSATDAVPP